ncbi:hypothetical protein SLS56_011714 [Neofusicoccum ribis]|uniref:Uncharacterized protein n=1 Tax=Neofusicoccum ribis TaxID=45134 RepID=A0ABR3SAW5_9PEZI
MMQKKKPLSWYALDYIAQRSRALLKDSGKTGLEHVAFTYNSLVELALAYRQKKNLGIEPTWCVNHGITTSICCQDPDGSNIETQVDNFGDNNGATAFVMAECFERNPVGIDFDPEDLIRRLESGEDQASIKQRPDAK